jgi:ribosomal protein RSM22 (predicted rRNA methylase)
MPTDVRLVRPLEDAWQAALDAILSRRKAPTTRDVAGLGARVAELSRAYNQGGVESATRAPLDARIGFSFARDVPKGAAAVRELVACGLLTLPADRPLSIVDLGAGLGAMTWGVVRALAAAGARGRVEALLVDDDAEALAAAEAIAKEAGRVEGVEVVVRTKRQRLAEEMHLPRADLVVMGQVLSELDLALDPATRVERHASLLQSVLEGADTVVVVEPALRDRTRHLHAVRDRLVGAGQRVFAPCLHDRPCPALAGEGDWCHEDLTVDLPGWLVPVARAAGLRWQGLTFSYLVLRRDGASLAASLPAVPGRRLRVISDRIVTKGKTEIFGCTAEGERVRLRRLDRDAAEQNEAWDELGRGDVVTLTGEGAIDERGRIAPHAGVDVWRASQ